MPLVDNLKFLPEDEFNTLKIKMMEDSHPDKMDVGAGVYRDPSGKSFTFPVVKKAKAHLAENDDGHDYNLSMGIPAFLKQAQIIGVGDQAVEEGRVASCQTIGGTGACHLGAVFLAQFVGVKKFYLGTPAWPNYDSVVAHAGGELITFEYYDSETKGVNFANLLKALNEAEKGSAFILQLCCHNPTASDLTMDQWLTIGKIMKEKDLLPFFDSAYQGFATGSTEADGAPVREFIKMGLEVIVAQSFSKNLGLYGERVGCLHVIVQDKKDLPLIQDQLRYIYRAECSSSPGFGSKVVSIVTNDDDLTTEWNANLREVATRLITTREEVYRQLKDVHKTPGDWYHVTTQRGLFWFSGLTQDQSVALTDVHHVYLPKSGRVNIAGLNENNIDAFCKAFDAVVRAY